MKINSGSSKSVCAGFLGLNWTASLFLGLFFILVQENAWALDYFSLDKAKFRQGAEVYQRYCAACHTLKYFTGKPSTFTRIAMSPNDATAWFGRVPPDLSLIVPARGRAWVSQYLMGFYPDLARPFGVNNSVLPDTAMPNVLGSLSPTQKEQAVAALVYFLDAVGYPAQYQSHALGLWVLGYLILLGFLLFALKKFK